MARPKQYRAERVTTAVRLPKPLHARLKAEAEARVVSVNLLVNRAVEAYLDGLDETRAIELVHERRRSFWERLGGRGD